jgi:hypothetical protein
MALFVLILFLCLLIGGLYMRELDWRHVAGLLLLVGGACVALGVFQFPGVVRTAIVAVIDVVLILVICKGDIRI